jgi:multiple sugar transport system ATP-binding protein
MVCVFRERIAAEPGATLRIKPDAALVHLFDEETGRRIN